MSIASRLRGASEAPPPPEREAENSDRSARISERAPRASSIDFCSPVEPPPAHFPSAEEIADEALSDAEENADASIGVRRRTVAASFVWRLASSVAVRHASPAKPVDLPTD